MSAEDARRKFQCARVDRLEADFRVAAERCLTVDEILYLGAVLDRAREAFIERLVNSGAMYGVQPANSVEHAGAFWDLTSRK